MTRFAIDMNTLRFVRLNKNGTRKRTPSKDEMAARGRSGAAMRKVKALLQQYPRIEVEKDIDAYWVYCDGIDPDDESDPLYDQHFAVGCEEVLEAVMVYARHIDSLAAEPYGPGALPNAVDESLEASHVSP